MKTDRKPARFNDEEVIADAFAARCGANVWTDVPSDDDYARFDAAMSILGASFDVPCDFDDQAPCHGPLEMRCAQPGDVDALRRVLVSALSAIDDLDA